MDRHSSARPRATASHRELSGAPRRQRGIEQHDPVLVGNQTIARTALDSADINDDLRLTFPSPHGLARSRAERLDAERQRAQHGAVPYETMDHNAFPAI